MVWACVAGWCGRLACVAGRFGPVWLACVVGWPAKLGNTVVLHLVLRSNYDYSYMLLFLQNKMIDFYIMLWVMVGVVGWPVWLVGVVGWPVWLVGCLHMSLI